MIYKNLICSGANFRLSAMQAFKQNKSIDVTTAQRTIALSCCCSSYSSSSQCRLIGWWRARLSDCVEIFVRACARLIIVISIRHSMRSMPSAAINSGAMRQLSTLLNWLALAASSPPEVHRCATATTQLCHCRQRMWPRTVAIARLFVQLATTAAASNATEANANAADATSSRVIIMSADTPPPPTPLKRAASMRYLRWWTGINRFAITTHSLRVHMRCLFISRVGSGTLCNRGALLLLLA